MFCQVIDWPTQRPGSISPSIIMEAENGHEPGDNVDYHAVHVRTRRLLDSGSCMGVVWQLEHTKLKPTKINSVCLLARYMKFAPMKISCDAVVAYLIELHCALPCCGKDPQYRKQCIVLDQFVMIKVVSLVRRVIHWLL